MKTESLEEEALRAAMDPSTSEKKILGIMRQFHRLSRKTQGLLVKHPNLPYDRWKKLFLDFYNTYDSLHLHEAWDSPHTALFLFDMSEDDSYRIKTNVYSVWFHAMEGGFDLSEDAKELILQQIDRWWSDLSSQGIISHLRYIEDLHPTVVMDIKSLQEKADKVMKNSKILRSQKADALRRALPPARELFSFRKQTNG